MQIVKYIFIISLFIGCTGEKKMNEKTVNIDYAKKDGFEMVAFKKGNPISLKYRTYIKNNPQLTYLVEKEKIKSIEKTLSENENTSSVFVKLSVKNIDRNNQNICLSYHYSKSTYTYCYSVLDTNVIPTYSEYQDLYKHEKINYITKSVK